MQMRRFIYIKVFWVKFENYDPKNVEIISWKIYKKKCRRVTWSEGGKNITSQNKMRKG